MISAFGTAMAPVAIAFGVLDLTGSASQMSVVVASQTIGAVSFQLLGGALADRGSRQQMMVRADLLAAICQGIVAALFLTGTAQLPALLGLMLLVGVAFALHGPSSQGLVPMVVERSQLQSANGLLVVGRTGAFALGAACAGVIVATTGAGCALAIDAATFAASALLIRGLRPQQQIRSARATLIHELRVGWREFTAHRWLWVIVAQYSIVVASWEGTFAVIGPTVAKRLLGGPADWGWLAGAFGLGTLVGGLLSLRVRVDRPMLFGSCLTLSLSLPALLLSGPATVPLIASGMFVTGVCAQLFSVLWFTTLQTHVPAEALSRVCAYDELGSTAFAPLGIIAAGVLLESIGFRHTLWISAALIGLPTFAVLAVRDVRTLRTV